MTGNLRSDVEFLKSDLKRLRQEYQLGDALCDSDLQSPQDMLPETSDNAEQCARLANQYGFDGNVFRNLVPPSLDERPNIRAELRILQKRIELIPLIISAIEQSNGIGQHTDSRKSIGEPRELAGQQDAGDKLDRLVTRSDVAKLIPRSTGSIKKEHTDEWGDPDELGRGRRGSKWYLTKILPILQLQFSGNKHLAQIADEVERQNFDEARELVDKLTQKKR